MATLRPDVADLLNRAAAAGRNSALDLSNPAAARAQHAASSRISDRPRAPELSMSETTLEGAGGPLRLRIYRPQARSGTGDAVLFLHGGGWMLGDLETHDGLAGAICEGLGLPVVAVDYRRAPEGRYPAALDDARAALEGMAEVLLERAGERMEGVVLAGDSAGGNMAASLALQPPAGLRAPIRALWTMYASFDMDASGGSMDAFADGYLLTADMLRTFRAAYFPPEADRRDPRASPLFADPATAPPALVFACGCDPLRDQSRAFAAKLAAAGRPVRYREAAGQVHGALTRRAAVPSGEADLQGCLQDLRALLAEAHMGAS